MRFAPIALSALLSAAPALAQQAPLAPVAPTPVSPPASGLPLLISGTAFGTAGFLALGALPACGQVTNAPPAPGAVPTKSPNVACLAGLGAPGGAFLIAGVALVAVGATRWKAFEAWALAPSTRGASLSWTARW